MQKPEAFVTYSKSEQQTGLSYTWVTNEEQLEKVITAGEYVKYHLV